MPKISGEGRTENMVARKCESNSLPNGKTTKTPKLPFCEFSVIWDSVCRFRGVAVWISCCTDKLPTESLQDKKKVRPSELGVSIEMEDGGRQWQ